jgi:hypothetical protein
VVVGLGFGVDVVFLNRVSLAKTKATVLDHSVAAPPWKKPFLNKVIHFIK